MRSASALAPEMPTLRNTCWSSTEIKSPHELCLEWALTREITDPVQCWVCQDVIAELEGLARRQHPECLVRVDDSQRRMTEHLIVQGVVDLKCDFWGISQSINVFLNEIIRKNNNNLLIQKSIINMISLKKFWYIFRVFFLEKKWSLPPGSVWTGLQRIEWLPMREGTSQWHRSADWGRESDSADWPVALQNFAPFPSRSATPNQYRQSTDINKGENTRARTKQKKRERIARKGSHVNNKESDSWREASWREE